MNSEKDASCPPKFSETPNRSAENSKCTRPNAVATMTNRPGALSAQNPYPIESHTHDPWVPPTSNGELSKAINNRSRSGKANSTIGFQSRSEKVKHKFQRCEAAHAKPIEGMVVIPGCIIRKKPNLLRIVRFSRSGSASVKDLTDPEIQALNTPIAPVNKDTTKELELNAIQNNTSLRIDLCFDDQLFFQPIKGRKGEEKQRKAKVFWDCLSCELDTYRHDLCGDCPECAQTREESDEPDVQIPSRLAEFFSALRDLIEMLVPDKDKSDIMQRLNVDELVRSSRTGIFDPVSFSGWLAQLLMTHCAPLRDSMARKMNQQIADGAQTNDMDLLVKGLETLLSLLENMKLDVANHQVRSFKLLLIADTVPFLQDCFSKLQSEQQLDPKGSRKWFSDIKEEYLQEDESMTDFEIFVAGTVRLCRSPCPSKAVPATFTYDKDRLVCLRNEMLDLTQLRICTDTFEELTISRQHRKPTVAECTQVRDRLLQLMSAEDGTSEGVACHLDEIATEIARASAGMSAELKPQILDYEAQDLDFQDALTQLENRFAMEQFNVMKAVLHDLSKLTLQFALQFQKLDTLQLSNAQRAWTAKRSSKGLVLAPDMDDIARRLAHIIVIHWQVWARLVYVEDSTSKPPQLPVGQNGHSHSAMTLPEAHCNPPTLKALC